MLKQPKQQISRIDLYLPGEARDTDPERNVSRFADNVKPLVEKNKETDPHGRGGIKITRPPSVYKQFLYSDPVQKDHMFRAQQRLSQTQKKQKFEELVNGYFTQQLPTAQQNAATPLTVMNAQQINDLETLIRNHDSQVLNDHNAQLHIVADTALLDVLRTSLTSDSWSLLLRSSLLLIYKNTGQTPPEWLQPGKTPIVPAKNHRTGTPAPEPTQPTQRAMTMTLETWKNLILNAIGNAAVTLEIGNNLYTANGGYPPVVYNAFLLSGFTSNVYMNLYGRVEKTETAAEIIINTLVVLQQAGDVDKGFVDEYRRRYDASGQAPAPAPAPAPTPAPPAPPVPLATDPPPEQKKKNP